jgi:hypothetical protein
MDCSQEEDQEQEVEGSSVGYTREVKRRQRQDNAIDNVSICWKNGVGCVCVEGGKLEVVVVLMWMDDGR